MEHGSYGKEDIAKRRYSFVFEYILVAMSWIVHPTVVAQLDVDFVAITIRNITGLNLIFGAIIPIWFCTHCYYADTLSCMLTPSF